MLRGKAIGTYPSLCLGSGNFPLMPNMPQLSPPPSSYGGFCPRSYGLGLFFCFLMLRLLKWSIRGESVLCIKSGVCFPLISVGLDPRYPDSVILDLFNNYMTATTNRMNCKHTD